jgi:Kef-type K+ transport system membrane component KefB
MHAVGLLVAAGAARTPHDAGISLASVLLVTLIACAAPVLVSTRPALRLPSVVVEIVLGIVVGPGCSASHTWTSRSTRSHSSRSRSCSSSRGWNRPPARLRGGLGRIAPAFVVSFVLCLVFGLGVGVIGETTQPVFIAIALASTSLGLVVPVLHDAGMTETRVGQLALGGAMVAEFATVLMLSLLFSNSSTSPGAQVALLVLFGVAVVLGALVLVRIGRRPRVAATIKRLENTSAQLGVRLAMALLVLMAFLATELGLETILGAFVAGALLRVIDPDERMCHTAFRSKMDAIGYGFLVPMFFVASGMRLDVQPACSRRPRSPSSSSRRTSARSSRSSTTRPPRRSSSRACSPSSCSPRWRSLCWARRQRCARQSPEQPDLTTWRDPARPGWAPPRGDVASDGRGCRARRANGGVTDRPDENVSLR